MELSFSTSQNGLYVGNQRQTVIADNLSNLTTPSFKAQLEDQETLRGPGSRIQSIRRDFSAGSPVQTERETDLYIAGRGFLQVQLETGTGYTRAGNLHIDREGQLVTPSGLIVEPTIVVPDEAIAIQISPDGVVTAINADQTAQEIGRFELARFVNPNGLVAVGDNLFVEGENSGDPLTGFPGDEGFGAISQGFLEDSNVDPATELTRQIVNQRYYQMNLRVLQTSDEMLGRAIDLFF